MSVIAKNSIGSQRQRQFSGPIDPDIVFETKSDMTAYLSRAIRYAGMVATCLEDEGVLYILNNDKDEWIEVNGNGDASVDVNSFTDSDIVAPVAVGNIAKGTIIPKGTNIQTFLRNFLFKAELGTPPAGEDPQIYESRVRLPSFKFNIWEATKSIFTVVVGDVISYEARVTDIDLGYVLGDYSGGTWLPNANRGAWAGAVSKVEIDGEEVTLTGDYYAKEFTDVTITSTPITHIARVTFADGTTARMDSTGATLNTYESSVETRSKSITGKTPVLEPEDTEPDVPVSYPTFVNPYVNATVSTALKADGTLDVTFSISSTEALSRGKILGDYESGVWSSTALQDYRAGSIKGYATGDTAEEAGAAVTWGDNSVRSKTINMPNETKTVYVAMQFNEGVQPVDSAGEDYGDPYAEGYVTTAVVVSKRAVPTYYYTGILLSSNVTNPTSLQGLGARNLGTATSFSFTVPAGTPVGTYPVFAYPVSKGLVSRVLESSGMEVGFTRHSSAVTIDGVSCYVYYYTGMAIAFPVDFRYEVRL
ncbi:MAG: hypothetical protein PHW40_02255 [Candidatus Izemoplasmatales bacterium]|nr:hypothetical protein [Candidatus Izemoplasmatales bacterium]